MLYENFGMLKILPFPGEIAPDFWHVTSCKGECVLECRHYKCAMSLGVHSVLCRLVKYNNVVKHLGEVSELIVPQVNFRASYYFAVFFKRYYKIIWLILLISWRSL